MACYASFEALVECFDKVFFTFELELYLNKIQQNFFVLCAAPPTVLKPSTHGNISLKTNCILLWTINVVVDDEKNND